MPQAKKNISGLLRRPCSTDSSGCPSLMLDCTFTYQAGVLVPRLLCNTLVSRLKTYVVFLHGSKVSLRNLEPGVGRQQYSLVLILYVDLFLPSSACLCQTLVYWQTQDASSER